MSLQLNQHNTQYTFFDDHVFIDGKYIKRKQVWYKQFTSEIQAAKVLEKLIINNNFYPDFTKSDMIEFNNSVDPQIKYYYYPKTYEIEKVRLYIVDNL
tara:strand:- start:4449 stop:4742 length:294 start_codon:yes stop_codon:yes gene_type:complete